MLKDILIASLIIVTIGFTVISLKRYVNSGPERENQKSVKPAICNTYILRGKALPIHLIPLCLKVK